MAFTKLYLTNRTPLFTPTNFRGAWDDTAAQVTGSLDPEKSDGGLITAISRAETSATANFDVLMYRGVSGPIAAQTFSGTINLTLAVSENSASANFAYHVHVYVTAGDTDTVRGTLLTDYVETTSGGTAHEWPTAVQGWALNAAQTLTGVVASDGDRIVVEVGYQAQNSVTTQFTGTLRYGTQNNPGGGIGDDLTAASTNVNALPGFILFSVAVNEAVTVNRVNERISQLPVEVIHRGSKQAQITQTPLEVIHRGSRAAQITQVAVEVITLSPVTVTGGNIVPLLMHRRRLAA